MPPPDPQQIHIKATPEAAAVADLVRRHIAPTLLDVKRGTSESASVLVLPDGLKAVDLKPLLDAYRVAPERMKGTAQAFEVDSFNDLVNRFKDEDSALFLSPDRAAPTLLAVLDYNRAREKATETTIARPGNARFGEHRVVYRFPLSDEWKAWLAANGKPLTQEQFAAWIEDHILDLMDPANADPSLKAFALKLGVPLATPSQLVALSRGLTVYAGYQVSKVVNLQTGEAQMTFSEEHKDATGAPLNIPGAFVVALPVFKSGTHFQLAVRLRYRVQTGSRTVAWSFELYQHERVFDAALEDAARIVKYATDLPLYRGTPEQQ